MPPKNNPTLYSVHKTFIWFAIVSFVLLLSLIGIVAIDYNRDWKVWQKKFVQMKYEAARKDLKDSEARIDKKALADLETQMRSAKADFKKHAAEFDALKRQSETLNTRLVKAKDTYQNHKQFQDSYRYYFEEYRLHKDPKAASYESKLKDLEPKLARSKAELEKLEKERADMDARLAGYGAGEKKLQASLDKLEEEKTRNLRRVEKLKPTLVKEVLNAPMLDFVAPTLKVQQIVLDGLFDDYNFAKVQKVDRCTTCHMGIDQKGFENAPQPFRTHPDLDLYLGSASPHPIEKVGCTVCHGGNGHSVSFVDASHTPRNEAQQKEWEKKYHWHRTVHWEPQMHAVGRTQASCTKCHGGVVEVPKADKLNLGRQLAMKNGCLNCHKLSGYEGQWKVGPDLQQVASKLDRDWILRWLQDPKAFRPTTNMPRIFHLSNSVTPEDRSLDDAAIHGITSYLLANSIPATLSKPAAAGDAARGEKLVKEVGCLGCHSAAGVSVNHYGPELSGLGSKVTSEWLFTWLKDPKHISPTTRMPNLRLGDQEASDITAYLLSQKNESFESQSLPQVKQEAVDTLALAFLQGGMRRSEAEAALAGMKPEEKLEFIGKKSISHQGCYGCHNIKGFEDAKPIGADLSNEGRKDIHQFDFGFIEIEHTRQGWIAQKLKDPRIFDSGKVKAYHDKLRMPQFNFTDDEIDALTTFVLSLTQEQIPLEMKKRLDASDVEAQKGRMLVAKLNCAGCHAIDGKPGSLREYMQSEGQPGQAPPNLEGQGAKTQEKWLHDFLRHPTPIRPWLTYRMPTFGLSDEEAALIVKYFANAAHQEISYHGYAAPASTDAKLQGGRQAFDKLQCVKCHQVNAESAAMGTSFLAPDLKLTKSRLKPEWVRQWLVDPQTLDPGTMMPTFFADGQTPLEDILGGDAALQIEAIRDYLYRYEGAAPADDKKAVAK